MYPTESQNTKVIIFLNGEIDLSNADISRKQIRGVLEQGKNLDINLEQVRYMDSSGVSILIEAMQETQRLGLGLELIDVSEEVMQVLELAHLHTILPVKSRASSDMDDIFASSIERKSSDDQLFDSIFSEDPFDSLFGETQHAAETMPHEPENKTRPDPEQKAEPIAKEEESKPNKPSRNPFIG